MRTMCQMGDYAHDFVSYADENPLDMTVIEKYLIAHGGDYQLICAVHSETSTGNINDIHTLAQLVRRHAHGARLFIDAMSSLGAVDIDLHAYPIDIVVSSANKCIQGVPGFAYVLLTKAALAACAGRCRSWAFDLCAQNLGFDKDGQFRCTPPTHALMAFRQALNEFKLESRAGREQRYRANNTIIRNGLEAIGFRPFDGHLSVHQRGFLITPFFYPRTDKFVFDTFYRRLSARGHVIYPGKVSSADMFRLGNIGELHAQQCHDLVDAIKLVLAEMDIDVPLKQG